MTFAHRFEHASQLDETASDVLSTLSIAGVNCELFPLVRMTAPPEWRTRSIGDWPTGERLFHSWILLFGLLPIDRHTFGLEAVDADTGFQEHSSSWLYRVWRHQRTVEELSGGCVVTDRVEFEPRLQPLGYLLCPCYDAVFNYRHWRLRRRFGGKSTRVKNAG